MKNCKHCHKDFSLKDFYKNSAMADGYYNVCKKCHYARVQKTAIFRPKPRVENPMGYPRWRKYESELIKKGIKMYKKGFSQKVIEAELGIREGTIRNYIDGRAKHLNRPLAQFLTRHTNNT